MSQKPNIMYFMPGQIIFHSKGQLDSDKLTNWASKIANSRGISLSFSKEALDFNPAPSHDLQPLNIAEQNKQLEQLGRSYRSPEPHPGQPFSLVSAVAQSERWLPSPTKPNNLQQPLSELFELILTLDGMRNDRENDAPSNLDAVSPNWLMSGSSQPGATGGPGALPTPYEGEAELAEFQFLFENTRLSTSNGEMSDKEVVVAILDTAPKLNGTDKDKVLKEIYEKWGPPSETKHPLIKTLLGDQGRLKSVYFDDVVDRPVAGVEQNNGAEPGFIQPEGHDYEMSDHGLFVAGIIHTLAPKAKLHLFQVLNRYGVGDILSIIRALKIIEADNETFPKERLLINLSLTINFPLEKDHGPNDEMLDKILRRYSEDPDGWQRQVEPIASICNSLYIQGAKVIAAAGNNRKGQHRPQACYPAAFESILGVGALPKPTKKSEPGKTKIMPASYSNRSDRPASTGITTLGGEEGPEQGILGIYLEEFPPSRDHKRPAIKSDNGWGWWAGTSFAAPIITGMTAAVRASRPDLINMEQAVFELFNAQSSKTEDNEDVLEITQGN